MFLSLSLVCLQIISTSVFCIAEGQKISSQNSEKIDPSLKKTIHEDSNQNSSISPILASKLNARLRRLVGSCDAVLLSSPQGIPILSRHSRKLLIPASTLKILTALVAIKYLGSDYRFTTDFYIDTDQNLKIKGYGDPMIVSEVLAQMAEQLTDHINNIKNIIIDDTYFDNSIVIPGKYKSMEPYDAPNGALCVNFNTVAFKKVHNTYMSAEKQTPLLPFALAKAKSSGLNRGRIMLAGKKGEGLQYAGELIQYFLKRAGIQVTGKIRQGNVNPSTDTLILHYLSQFNLTQVITSLMDFSNNFIANQLFLTSGAVVLGPPATLTKGVQVAHAFVHKELGLKNIKVVEGSGLSRQNRVSAEEMMVLLQYYKPFYHLLRYKKKEYYKTGTLNDVKARVGYLEDDFGKRYTFVVMINTPGKTTKAIMQLFRETVSAIKH
jgi:D-alanyl-D-alanine carboxypeptidase/D-alanyl-D-alanine-endopeptidase (penicillin-binding protein 4)